MSPLTLSALLLVLLLGGRVQAEPPLTLQLVSEITSITPGQPFYVGLALHHAPGYHTYWKSGGIVGVPTSIQWSGLPRGFKASDIEWPEPELTRMYQIQCQGYERDVVLPILITPPAKLPAGTTVRLTGKATWMACNRECNPGFAELTLQLPVKPGTRPDYNAEWRPRFQKERARPLRQSSAWAATASLKNGRITLQLAPQSATAAPLRASEAASIRFYTEDGSIDTDKPQTVDIGADGHLRLTLVPSAHLDGKAPKRLAGVVVRKAGWHSDGTLRALQLAPVLLK